MRLGLAMCLLALPLQAQERLPVTVKGTAVDSVGAVVPQLRIEFDSARSTEKYMTVADDNGRYVIKVPAGDYVVKSSLQCIGSYKKRRSLKPGKDVHMEIKLHYDRSHNCSVIESRTKNAK